MEKSEIKKIIQEEIQYFFEDLTFDYNKTYYPPQDVINACSQALQIVQKNNLTSHGGNEGSGLDKAKSIINKKPMSHAVLKRMKAFFDNNVKNVINLKNKGASINDSGEVQTWELWGGDAGRRWVENEIAKLNQSNLKSKKLKRDSGIQKTSTLMDPYNTRVRK